ncbi:hypothetical protein BJX99DRAFT_236315 [Aspergillus californicus]
MPPTALTLYRGWLEPNRYVWSPFVIKLEARLRFANIPYKTASGSVKTAPKGKIPYIEIPNGADTEDGVTQLGDSTLIIKDLVERGILPDLNSALSPADKAHDLALRALLEDKAYFYNTRERWTENYYTMRDHVLSSVPYPVRVIVGLLIHRGTVQTLHGQGTGRYTADEITLFRREVYEALNNLLVASRAKDNVNADTKGSTNGSKSPFWVLGGDEPSEADTTVYGFIISAFICDAGPKARELLLEFPAIKQYARRIHDAYFPEYEAWSEE